MNVPITIFGGSVLAGVLLVVGNGMGWWVKVPSFHQICFPLATCTGVMPEARVEPPKPPDPPIRRVEPPRPPQEIPRPEPQRPPANTAFRPFEATPGCVYVFVSSALFGQRSSHVIHFLGNGLTLSALQGCNTPVQKALKFTTVNSLQTSANAGGVVAEVGITGDIKHGKASVGIPATVTRGSLNAYNCRHQGPVYIAQLWAAEWKWESNTSYELLLKLVSGNDSLVQQRCLILQSN